MCGIFDRTNQTSPGTCYRSCPWSNEFFWSLVFLSRGMFALSSLYVVALAKFLVVSPKESLLSLTPSLRSSVLRTNLSSTTLMVSQRSIHFHARTGRETINDRDQRYFLRKRSRANSKESRGSGLGISEISSFRHKRIHSFDFLREYCRSLFVWYLYLLKV